MTAFPRRFSMLMLLVLALVAGAVLADEPADGKALLAEAIAAAEAVDSLHYHATVVPEGVMTKYVGPADGEGVIVGWNSSISRPHRFWTHLSTTLPGTTEAVTLTGGSDGEMFYIVDHSTKKGYEDIDPGVLGSTGESLVGLAPLSLVNDDPYRRDLDGESHELLGKETVNGVECHQLRVVYGGRGVEKESVWSFGVEDKLPRRLVRQYDFRGEPGTVTIDYTQLDASPEIDDSLFSMTLPEGFEQIDDFAP